MLLKIKKCETLKLVMMLDDMLKKAVKLMSNDSHQSKQSVLLLISYFVDILSIISMHERAFQNEIYVKR
jgi:hypothetical protein